MDLPASRTLTFLFTDLEGSTRLWELTPEAMQRASLIDLGQHRLKDTLLDRLGVRTARPRR